MTAFRFALVHGAWHGAWCWERVREHLTSTDHEVHTPTLPGLAERAHLMSREVTLARMIEDVTSTLEERDLNDVVLVGHSFSGAVVAGVADKLPERLQSLIFLDGAIVESGEVPFDRVPPDTVNERIRLAHEFDGGVSMPPPPPESFGLGPDEQWAASKLTPHPLASYQTKLQLEHPLCNGVPTAYIMCTKPYYEALESSRTIARAHGWRLAELDTAHDAMILAPDATASVLTRLASELRP